MLGPATPLLLPIPTSSLDHVKTCVPTRTKTQIFQSKHLFPKKQLTFRGHSVRHYEANAHSNHHQGALNSFVAVLCGLHQFSRVKPEGNDVSDQTDKTPATVKKAQYNLSPTLTHRQPRRHANSNTSNLLCLFCGEKQSICWVKRQHSDPIHWLMSQLLQKSWLQEPPSCQNSGKNSSTQTWVSILNRMRM